MSIRRLPPAAAVTMVLFTCAIRVPADPAPPATQPILIRECLVLASSNQQRRSPVHTDPVEAQIVAGSWKAPKEGDTVESARDKSETWKKIDANADGWFDGRALGNGYAYVAYESAEPRIVMLEAMGHNMVYVNGEPRMGDPYSVGYVSLPVQLRKGVNDLLFLCGRGRLRVQLVQPAYELFIDTRDATLPDYIIGFDGNGPASVVVVNASSREVRGIRLAAGKEGVHFSGPIPDILIPPCSIRKLSFWPETNTTDNTAEVPHCVMCITSDSRPQTSPPPKLARVTFRRRLVAQTRRVTFFSDIDGSVQYYALNSQRSDIPRAAYQFLPIKWEMPQKADDAVSTSRALVLSLHGASVEALGQADAYSSKPWADIVCPTNRRPYGFDWEDWGRMDAIEVLDLAQKALRPDPTRIYLTGHSMGGHGTWSVGAIYPDRFAAIGPSAGWESFSSYAGGARIGAGDPIREIMRRAAATSDTLALARNYLHEGVYVLHGDKDDNVPVTQARTMYDALSKFHHDIVKFEKPGAGHWWDDSDEPGASCVDWPPMFDFFVRHRLPSNEEVRSVEFVTVNPEVSSRCHWATIEAQAVAMVPSVIDLRWDPGLRRFAGTTKNVARLSLDFAHVPAGEALNGELDGQKLGGVPPPTGEASVWLERVSPASVPASAPASQPDGGTWQVVGKPSARLKGPHRSGPFKLAFRSRFMLVYGTRGSREENTWALAKARFDAENWWYRANGSVDVTSDIDFNRNSDIDRCVILYGNADTNAAWADLLRASPVQVSRTGVAIGGRRIAGDDLACLFIQPRPDSDTALVGVIGGTGIRGMRLTDRLPIFISGVAYPDCIVLGPEVLREGVAGIRAAGFFGADWSVARGEFAWHERAGD